MFVSYAQNFEDIALWRALGHIRDGFYIDLGAQHPVTDSVSRAFYEHGWRGIHVEPVPAYAELLVHDRPDETVVRKAIGTKRGTMTMHVLSGSGLSTLDPPTARRGEELLGCPSSQIEVEVVPLDDVLALRGDKPIHWMKIDIEGSEKAALSSWTPAIYRPWIILVEATLPGSQIPSYAEWEPILLAADYTFAYFDGLNRFYVAREHPELLEPIRQPPSVFDQYISHETVLREQLIERLTLQLAQTVRPDAMGASTQTSHAVSAPLHNVDYEVDTLRITVRHLVESQLMLRKELDGIYGSRSWRLAVLLRKAMVAQRVLRSDPRLFLLLVRENLKKIPIMLKVLQRLGLAGTAPANGLSLKASTITGPGGKRRSAFNLRSRPEARQAWRDLLARKAPDSSAGDRP